MTTDVSELRQGSRREGIVPRSVDHLNRMTGLAVSQFYLVCVTVTVWEVFARYVLNLPTYWAFEVVMVFCSSAWLLSAGYVTLFGRHIGITVFREMAGPRLGWWLDGAAMVIGIVALTLFIDDNMLRSLSALKAIERTGAGFNSPQPTLLKTALTIGSLLYLAQLLVNLWRHLGGRVARATVALVAALIFLRFGLTLATQLGWDMAFLEAANRIYVSVGQSVNPQHMIDARSYDLGLVTACMVGALFLLMMTGIPLGIVTLTISIASALVFFGPAGLFLVSSNAFGLAEQYALVAVPLFVLMATILERAGIARDLFDAMAIFAGSLRGGVAVQTTVVAVILAAMSGVMGGEIVMLGLVALPQMLRLGYDVRLSTGVICAAGSLATLIPPSIVMIVYGLSASVGIGDLFLAGFLPGLMLAIFYAVYVLVRCALNPRLAPTAAEVSQNMGQELKLSQSQKIAVLLCISLIFGVMGSIYAGIATVTEAAGVGVVGAILVAAVRHEFNWKMLQRSLATTNSNVATIFWLVVGAVSLVGIFNLIGGSAYMRQLFAGFDMPPLVMILIMMAVLTLLGTFMDWISITFLTVPVFAPIIRDLGPQLGMSGNDTALWFGVLFAMNVQVAFLSPPFGPACFWLKSVAPKEVSLHQIFLGVLPFICLQILGIILVMLFPQIALYLPSL